MTKRLFRSRDEKVVGGVCGGIAEYYDVDPTLVRLGTILLVLGLGFPVVAYLVGWVIIPRRPFVSMASNMASDMASSAADTEAFEKKQAKQAAKDYSQKVEDEKAMNAKPMRSSLVPGIIIVSLGLFAMFEGYFWWHWEDFLPVGLVVIGIYLIVRHLDFSATKNNSDTADFNGANGSGSATAAAVATIPAPAASPSASSTSSTSTSSTESSDGGK